MSISRSPSDQYNIQYNKFWRESIGNGDILFCVTLQKQAVLYIRESKQPNEKYIFFDTSNIFHGKLINYYGVPHRSMCSTCFYGNTWINHFCTRQTETL